MATFDLFRSELIERRIRLEQVLSRVSDTRLSGLLKEVDSALARIEEGSFGLCRVCLDPIESDRLLANPLACTCLDHLTKDEHRALEDDLDLAGLVQQQFLPERRLTVPGWEYAYFYRPFRVASGDYVDVFQQDGCTYFVVADVAGKGIAASMLVANLRGLFRTLAGRGRDLAEHLRGANRLFCESTLSSHYATLVCAKADPCGSLEVVNAGHNSPLLQLDGNPVPIESSGLPLGLFSHSEYGVERFSLHPGDNALFFTDGFSEARAPSGEEYGEARLRDFLNRGSGLKPERFVEDVIRDLETFLAGEAVHDDLTILHLKRL